MSIGPGNQIRTTFRNIIRMTTLQGGILMIREFALIAIGFVAAGDDYAFDRWIAPGGFEEKPGPFDVGLEGGQRNSVSNAHNRLGSQVEDRINFIFGQCPLQEDIITQVAYDDVNLLVEARAGQFCVRNLVPYQANDLGPGRYQGTR